MEKLLSRANLRHVDLSIYCNTITNEICSLLCMAPNLISLDLSLVQLTENNLATIANSCPILEKLFLENSLPEIKIDGILTVLFNQCSKLKYLNLPRNYLLNGECFVHIPFGLLYLNLAGCRSLNSLNILSERAANLETLILKNYPGDLNDWVPKFKKIRFLEITHYYGNSSFLDLSELIELEILCLRQNKITTFETLESLRNCSKLKALDLSYNHQLNSDVLYLLKELKSLKHIDLSALSYLLDVASFVDHSQIEYLTINYCYDLPEDDVKKLVTQCNSLTHLELICCTNQYHKVLSSCLSKKSSQRQNNLKIVIQKGLWPLPSCKWCEVIIRDKTEPPPFSQFFDIENRYKK